MTSIDIGTTARGMRRTDAHRYPLEPLAEATGMTVAGVLRACGAAGGQWVKYRTEGVSEATADRYAVRLGLHPYEVWPEMADHHLEEAAAQERERKAATERARYHSNPAKRARKIEMARRYYEEHGEYVRARQRAKPYDPAARRAKYLRAKERAAKALGGAA